MEASGDIAFVELSVGTMGSVCDRCRVLMSLPDLLRNRCAAKPCGDVGDIGRAGDEGVVGLEDGRLIPAVPNGFAGVTAGKDGLEDDLDECDDDALTGLLLAGWPDAAGDDGAVRILAEVAEPEKASSSGDSGIPSGIGMRPEMLTLRLALRLADWAAFKAASSSEIKAPGRLPRCSRLLLR